MQRIHQTSRTAVPIKEFYFVILTFLGNNDISYHVNVWIPMILGISELWLSLVQALLTLRSSTPLYFNSIFFHVAEDIFHLIVQAISHISPGLE